MSRRRLLVVLLAGTAVLVTCWATRARLLRAAASWLDVGEPPRKADYVMLLNGGEDSRPFAAAALLKAHWVRCVLVAETAPSPAVRDGIMPPDYEIDRRVLLKRGVPAADVTVLTGMAATTYDEAVALDTFLQNKPNARVLVVTSDYHTRRSRWVFARVLGDRAGQVLVRLGPERRIPDGPLVAEPGRAAVDRDGIPQTRLLRRQLRIPGPLAGGLRRIVPGRPSDSPPRRFVRERSLTGIFMLTYQPEPQVRAAQRVALACASGWYGALCVLPEALNSPRSRGLPGVGLVRRIGVAVPIRFISPIDSMIPALRIFRCQETDLAALPTTGYTSPQLLPETRLGRCFPVMAEPRRRTRAVGRRLLGWALLGLVLCACQSGCVERRLMVRTNPPGALLYVDDYPIGTTPCSTSFTYYGTRKIQLVKDGYETLTLMQSIPAPWYEYTPFDFVAENFVPGHIRDQRTLDFQLRPQVVVPTEQLLSRAEGLRRGIHTATRTAPQLSPGGVRGPTVLGPTAAPPTGPEPIPAPPGVGGQLVHPLP